MRVLGVGVRRIWSLKGWWNYMGGKLDGMHWNVL
jgi:hypothetical protein